MKGLKKGLGIYLILFFAMFCGIIWYMNKNSKTDSGYTIVDFQAEVSEDLIGSVEIYQNRRYRQERYTSRIVRQTKKKNSMCRMSIRYSRLS